MAEENKLKLRLAQLITRTINEVHKQEGTSNKSNVEVSPEFAGPPAGMQASMDAIQNQEKKKKQQKQFVEKVSNKLVDNLKKDNKEEIKIEIDPKKDKKNKKEDKKKGKGLKSAISASVEEYKEEKKAAIEKSISKIPVIGNIFKAYKDNKKPKKDSKEADKISDNSNNKIELLKKSNVILTQISDNFYNIAGKMGAQVSSMKDVEDAIINQEKQADQIKPAPDQPQAIPAGAEGDSSKKGKKISTKTKAAGLGILGLVGVALMFGKDIIEGMVNFFKNPFEIISNLLGSLGEGIVEWFEEGGFKDFIVEAFEEGKKELIKTFENLKDIFKIFIGDPVANLIDDIKLYFIGMAVDGLKMLPDWLKGDSVKEIEKNLEKAKSNIEAGKETRAQENQATRAELKKRMDEPAVSSAEPPKQTVEDLKEEAPQQQEPVPTPPQPAPAPTPTPSVTTATGAAVATESGAALKTGAEEQQAIPVAADKKPTAVGAIKMPDETVGAAIKEAAKKVGTDESIMLAMAKQESGFNPAAKASTSSAKGLFQFLDSTWKGMADKYSKSFPELLKGPMDVLASAISGALYIKENSEYLKKNNIPVTGTTIYASHFLGPGGARRLLQADPNAIAASLPGMEGPANANKNIFYKPGPDKKPNLSAPRTAGEIMEVLYNKVGKSAEQYAAVANSPSVGGNISVASASVNSSKKQPSQQVVYNINNSVATAVKVGAPQGSSTTVARPVGTA